jgi:hypothetical protein
VDDLAEWLNEESWRDHMLRIAADRLLHLKGDYQRGYEAGQRDGLSRAANRDHDMGM